MQQLPALAINGWKIEYERSRWSNDHWRRYTMTDAKNMIFSWLTNGVEPSRTKVRELTDAILYGSPAQSPARRAAMPITSQEWEAVGQKDIDGAEKPVPPRAGGINGTVRAVGQGVLGIGSFLDEMDAATNATLAPAFDPLLPDSFEKLPGETWSERYDQALEIQRRDSREYDEDHPYLSPFLKLAGGIGSGGALLKTLPTIGNYALGNTGASLVGRVGSGTVAGAGTGIVQGYGAGEGGAENRLSEAGTEALWGAGTGAVAVPLASGLGMLGSAAYRKLFGKSGMPPWVEPGAAEQLVPAGGNVASKGDVEYDPPAVKRPFEVDYPGGKRSYVERGIADENGKPLKDIDGYPFDPGYSGYIAGGKAAGSPDTSLTAGELEDTVKRRTGRVSSTVPRSKIWGDNGVTWIDGAGDPAGVEIADDLNPRDRLRVLAHEAGHTLRKALNEMSIDGVEDDLYRNYYIWRYGKDPGPGPDGSALARQYGPEYDGYRPDEVGEELRVEGVRGYMTGAGYMKERYPNLAARMREHFRNHPDLKDLIRLNIWPFVTMGAGIAGAGTDGLAGYGVNGPRRGEGEP